MSNTVTVTVESGKVYLAQEAWQGHPDPYEDALIEVSLDDAICLLEELKSAIAQATN